jgi:hypothetical protein
MEEPTGMNLVGSSSYRKRHGSSNQSATQITPPVRHHVLIEYAYHRINPSICPPPHRNLDKYYQAVSIENALTISKKPTGRANSPIGSSYGNEVVCHRPATTAAPVADPSTNAPT